MVVCKYHLQGTCKFGSACRFEHPPSVNAGQSNTADEATLVKAVQTDMLNTERGRQWLLSTYGPYKEKDAFPGFEDRSFEEVRFGYIDAMKKGTIEQYKAEFQNALQEAAMKVRTLQTPNADQIKILLQIYGNANAESANSTSSVFSNNPVFGQPSSAFGNPSNSVFSSGNTFNKSPYGGAATSSGPFSGASNNSPFTAVVNQASPFGGTASKSPFALASTSSPFAQTNSPFSSATTNSPFAAVTTKSPFVAASSSSPFAMAVTSSPFAAVAANSPFATATITTTSAPFASSPFASSNPPFVGATAPPVINPSPFSSSTPQFANASPFAASTASVASTPFAPAPVTTAPFSSNSPFISSNQSYTPFAAVTSATSSPFATVTPATSSPFAAVPSATSSFGGTAQVVKNLQVQVDPTLYSKQEELSVDDLAAFESDHFEFGKIPVIPPTVQLCF